MATMGAAVGIALMAASLSGCTPPASSGPAWGYGVGPVEGETLPAMVARCTAGGFATPECAQFQRTRQTQPGNAAP